MTIQEERLLKRGLVDSSESTQAEDSVGVCECLTGSTPGSFVPFDVTHIKVLPGRVTWKHRHHTVYMCFTTLQSK